MTMYRLAMHRPLRTGFWVLPFIIAERPAPEKLVDCHRSHLTLHDAVRVGSGLSGISYVPCLLAARIAADDLHRSKNAPPPHRARPLYFFCLGCLVYDAPRDAFARTHPISAIIDRAGQTVSHSARRSRGRISVYCTIRNKQDLSLVYEGGKRAGEAFTVYPWQRTLSVNRRGWCPADMVWWNARLHSCRESGVY